MTSDHLDALKKPYLCRKSCRFGPLKLLFRPILAPCSGVVRSSCLGVWFARLKANGLPALDSSCDLDDTWFGGLSFDLSELRLPGEA